MIKLVALLAVVVVGLFGYDGFQVVKTGRYVRTTANNAAGAAAHAIYVSHNPSVGRPYAEKVADQAGDVITNYLYDPVAAEVELTVSGTADSLVLHYLSKGITDDIKASATAKPAGEFPLPRRHRQAPEGHTMTVKVITDSSCDLPQLLADELDIAIVPLTVRFGNEEFLDRQDLTSAEFWSRCEQSPTLPETAAPSPGQFETAYREAAAHGHEGVVVVTISGGLSATVQSAQVAADAVADTIPVRVIDSRQVSGALGLVALAAGRLAQAGRVFSEDVAGGAADEATRTRLLATFDTLDNLRKGGRIGRAQAFFGTVLSMKPVIEIVDGVVEAESRQRTRGKSLRYLADKVRQAAPVEHLLLLHADADDHPELLNMLSETLPRDQIIVTNVGAVIGTHSGPRAMGVAFTVPGS